MRWVAVALWLGLIVFAPACSSKPKPDSRYLDLRPNPPSPASLSPGSRIEIAAVAVPAAELQWVSGTVQLFGAPTLAFKKDAKDGLFKFKTMVPPMVEVPAGSYQIKVWGKTTAGEAVAGRMDYEVR